jgi:hypothetical protein
VPAQVASDKEEASGKGSDTTDGGEGGGLEQPLAAREDEGAASSRSSAVGGGEGASQEAQDTQTRPAAARIRPGRRRRGLERLRHGRDWRGRGSELETKERRRVRSVHGRG